MPKLIYMLEDDSDDRYLTNEVVDELGLDINIRFFSSSTELMDSLHEDLPAMILVDYNSSPENGLAVLQRIREHGHTSALPVIILTENNYPSLKKNCYSAGASTVISKPRDMMGTRERIKTFFEYWLNVAEV
jgi:CheY-like chemotaxis protein